MVIKKHGFAALTKAQHATISRKGGQVTNVSKGFAKMTPEQRKEAGQKGALIRWSKKRKEKNE